MHQKRQQIFLRTLDSRSSQALILDPTRPITLRDLKLFLLRNNSSSASCYITVNGKPLDDSTRLPGPRVAPLSTLVFQFRLSGGGGDGGATGAESRDCYLNMYAEKKPDKVDPNEQRLSKWLNCALSFEPLTQPCVIDKLGNVFNKEALVEGLIGKKLPKEFSFIKGLKDMIDVKLETLRDSERSDNVKFQCPITGLEFNGKYKFFALRSCGHVLSAKALKEVKSSACLVCYKEFGEEDKIVINGSEEEVESLRERMVVERVRIKDKKSKKVKNGEVGASEGLESSKLSGKKHGVEDAKDVERDTAERNGKVENGRGGRGGSGGGSGGVKRFKAVDAAPTNANKEVYASIFTSSKKKNFKETFTCRSLPLGRN